MHLAIGLVLIGKEHHAELTDNCVEADIRERQRHSIGWLELDLLVGPKLGASYLKHRRIEIGRGQPHSRGQHVAQLPRDDPGAGRRLQHPGRSGRGDTLRDVGCIVDEDHRPEAMIVVLWYAAGEPCRVIPHDETPIAPEHRAHPRSDNNCIARRRHSLYGSRA